MRNCSKVMYLSRDGARLPDLSAADRFVPLCSAGLRSVTALPLTASLLDLDPGFFRLPALGQKGSQSANQLGLL